MLDKPRRRRQAPDVETNTGHDVLRDDLRRRNRQHPVHDEEDATPSDYEREINRLDTASFERIADN